MDFRAKKSEKRKNFLQPLEVGKLFFYKHDADDKKLLCNKYREYRNFVLVHILSPRQFHKVPPTKRFIMEDKFGLTPLIITHIALLNDGYTIEILIDRDFVNRLLSFNKYHGFLISKTDYSAIGKENKLLDFMQDVQLRMNKYINDSDKKDRIYFRDNWNRLTSQLHKGFFCKFFYNEQNGEDLCD